jgi:hypothetical protein
MRSVSRRFVRGVFVLTVFTTMLSAQGALAAQRDDGGFGPRGGIFQRVRQFVVHVLDDWSWPKP